jgi:hypothetical protein
MELHHDYLDPSVMRWQQFTGVARTRSTQMAGVSQTWRKNAATSTKRRPIDGNILPFD